MRSLMVVREQEPEVSVSCFVYLRPCTGRLDSDGSASIDQIQQLFVSLQKKNDDQFKHLNKKLEMKLGAGKVGLVFLYSSM